LGRHTRELADWSWGDAAVHLSSSAAQRFGLTDRGHLREGQIADIAVVDTARVGDHATYAEPLALAVGIDDVIVNGQFVLREGAPTGVPAGRALRRGERPA
ncbi:MAG: D-aminoacylase, partial [Aeromicrobium sp.]|nr:D-aminoacylase [Aeromicrobium sp.]